MKSKYTKYILLFLFPISGIIVWYIDKLINKFIFFPENYLTYLMQILGLVSISLLSLNFVLSLKTRTTEKIFGGLDDQYKLHKLVGKIAMITIIFHIGFGIIRSLPSAKAFSLYLIPGTNVNYNFGIFAFWILIVLIFITLYLKLPYHIWKFTHRFLILPLILSVIHIVLTSYSPTQVPLIVTFLIVIGLIGVSAYIYSEFILYNFGPVYKYKIKEVNVEGNIIELFLDPVDKQLKFKAGQYIFLSFLNNESIESSIHPFSISTAPNEKMRISLKVLGDYTNRLRLAKQDDIVKLIGPFGEFHNDNFIDKKTQVWIAGGIGVTPFLSMLRERFIKGINDTSIYFFYCVNKKEDAFYMNEINELAKKLENIQIFMHYSEEEGFINSEYLRKKIGSDFDKSFFLICGPTKLMTSLDKDLKRVGKKSNDLFYENFSFK